MASPGHAQMPTELTSMELALLALSNSRDPSADSRQCITLTTKDAYVWASFLAILADSDLLIQPALLLDAIQQEMKPQQLEQMRPSESPALLGAGILKRVAKRLLSPPPQDLDIWFQGLAENADRAFAALIHKGFVEDPLTVAVGGLAMVVMGLIPVSFTRQTEKGGQELLRITSLFYQYEQSLKDGLKTVDVRFNLLALVKAFHAGASSAFTETWEQINQGKTSPIKARLATKKQKNKQLPNRLKQRN
jgi:hypothetical protein